MNLRQQIDLLIAKKHKLNQEFEDLKDEFKLHITDKSISLLDRWDFWKNAPTDLKDHRRWIYSGSKMWGKYFDNNYFSDMYGYGRGSTIDTANLFEDLVDVDKFYPENRIEMSLEDLTILLEEVLANNFASFIFDW